MSHHNRERKPYADEITIEEVISALASIIRWTRSNILGLLLSFMLISVLGIIWYNQQEEHYVAELTFMLNDDNNPQVSGISGVLSQFGITSSGGKYNVDKLLKIARSQRIIEGTLLREATIAGSTDLLANHFIEIYDLDKAWADKRPHLEGYLVRPSATRDQDYQYVIKSLKTLITGYRQNESSALLSSDYGNTDYIMSFQMKSLSDSLSVTFVNELYEEVSTFFVSKSVERSQKILDLITTERDSLSELITNTAEKIAIDKDKSISSYSERQAVRINLLESKLIGYQLALKQIAENLGRAEYAVKANAPLIQLLDAPYYPLSPQKPSLIRTLFISFILGCVLYITFGVMKKVMRKV